MSTKTITCREHGGTFTIPSQRGRPPVRCSVANPCTNAPEVRKPNATSRRNPGVQAAMVVRASERKTLADMDLPELRAYARSIGMSTGTKLTNRTQLRNAIRRYQSPVGESITAEPQQVAQEAPIKAPRRVAVAQSADTPSVSKAHAAKELLEAQGWHCSARVSTRALDKVEMTATRGEELLVFIWHNGALVSQTYTLWDTMKPSKNNMPAHQLPFDPDELSDGELVRALSGMKVTWWNRIASSEETAVVSPNKVNITHAYNGTGDEVPGDRVITFVDHSGAGFRTFRAGALLKIG